MKPFIHTSLNLSYKIKKSSKLPFSVLKLFINSESRIFFIMRQNLYQKTRIFWSVWKVLVGMKSLPTYPNAYANAKKCNFVLIGASASQGLGAPLYRVSESKVIFKTAASFTFCLRPLYIWDITEYEEFFVRIFWTHSPFLIQLMNHFCLFCQILKY